MDNPVSWEWVKRRNPNQVSVGDIANYNDIQFICIHIDEHGVATWEDVEFKNLKDERPEKNSIIRARYRDKAGEVHDHCMNEKFIDRIQSDNVEWLPWTS